MSREEELTAEIARLQEHLDAWKKYVEALGAFVYIPCYSDEGEDAANMEALRVAEERLRKLVGDSP